MSIFTGKWCDYCIWGEGLSCPPEDDYIEAAGRLPCEYFAPTCDPDLLGIAELDGWWCSADKVQQLLLEQEMEEYRWNS